MTKDKEKKIYYKVFEPFENMWWYFDNYSDAYCYLGDLRNDGNADKYQRVKEVLMTEEEFNNLECY